MGLRFGLEPKHRTEMLDRGSLTLASLTLGFLTLGSLTLGFLTPTLTLTLTLTLALGADLQRPSQNKPKRLK